MFIGRVDGDLGRSATRNVVGGGILFDINDGDHSPPGKATPMSCSVPVACNCPSAIASITFRTFALKTLPGNCVEGYLSLVSGADALQRILLKSGGKRLVVLVHEHHDGAQPGAGTTYIPGRSAICVT